MTDNKNEKPRTTKKRPGETGAEDNKNLRTKRFEMRLTPEEWNSLSLRSKEAGYSSTSLYARAILLPEHNQRHQEFKKETQLRVQLLASLGKIGSNINQVSHEEFNFWLAKKTLNERLIHSLHEKEKIKKTKL